MFIIYYLWQESVRLVSHHLCHIHPNRKTRCKLRCVIRFDHEQAQKLQSLLRWFSISVLGSKLHVTDYRAVPRIAHWVNAKEWTNQNIISKDRRLEYLTVSYILDIFTLVSTVIVLTET